MTADVARYGSQKNQWLATSLLILTMLIIGNLESVVTRTIYDLRSMCPGDFERPCTVVAVSGGVIGAIIGAISADMVGRRAALFGIFISIIYGINGMLPISIIGSYISLLASGISTGIAYTVVPLYISEIADDKIRGRLLVLSLVWPYSYVSYLVDNDVNFVCFRIIPIVFPILFLATFFWFPETPYHLVLKKKYQLATESVSFFRGIDEVAAKEDVDGIIATIEADGASPGLWNKIRDLFTGKGRKPLMIITFLVIVQWSSGFVYQSLEFSIILNDVTRFNNLYHAQMTASIALLVWIVFLAFTIDLVGRKFYLLGSALVGLMMMIFATGIHVQRLASTSAVTLCNLVIIIVPFVLIGELFPTKVKSVASGMLTIFALLLKFFVQCLGREWEKSQLHVLFAMYVFAFVIVLAFLPETKKMSFAKIQSVLAQTE